MITQRWTLVLLSGYLQHPTLCSLPTPSVARAMAHVWRPPVPYSWFSALKTGGTPSTEQLQTEELKEGQSCTSQAFHQVESIICGTQEMLTP